MKRTAIAIGLATCLSVCLAADPAIAAGGGGAAGLPALQGAPGAMAMEVVDELSSPYYEGRQAGHEGGKRAGAYVKAVLEGLGLKVVAIGFPERVPVYVREPLFALTRPDGSRRDFRFRQEYRDVAIGAWIEAEAEGPLAMVGSPYDDFPRGAIAVISGEDYDNALDEVFLSKGAKGLLVLMAPAAIERRATYPGQGPLELAAPRRGLVKMAVTSSLEGELTRVAAEGARAKLVNPLAFEDRELHDYLAIWNGDGGDFQPRFMLSAHYDHVGREAGGASPKGPDGSAAAQGYFPGALDNASGTGLLIALAADLAKAKPEADIAFLLTDGEEVNLSGSTVFASAPPFPLRGLAAINLDMVGGSGPTILSIFSCGDEASLALGDRVARALAGAGIESKAHYPIYGVDSAPLAEAGATAITLCEYDTAAYHSARDGSHNVSADELARLEAALLDLVLLLASEG